MLEGVINSHIDARPVMDRHRGFDDPAKRRAFWSRHEPGVHPEIMKMVPH
jgi:hypothetical protein